MGNLAIIVKLKKVIAVIFVAVLVVALSLGVRFSGAYAVWQGGTVRQLPV